MMKLSEENSNFPIEVLPNEKIETLIEQGEVSFEDLKPKHFKLFKRIYPFTPNKDLCRKFGINNATFQAVVKKIEEDTGEPLLKDPEYSATLVNPNPNSPPAKKESPHHLLSSYMNTMSEEERRDLINIIEEGIVPIKFMREIIVAQSNRAIRGARIERANSTPNKVVEDSWNNLSGMVYRLHEMEEGQRLKVGFDDTFAGLILAATMRKNQQEEIDDDVIDI